MQNIDFHARATSLISQLYDVIEQEDLAGSIDIDFHGDILYLTTDQGIFVINKHSAAKEIWLSSPVSGPYHFFYSNNIWQSKAGGNLITILSSELKINFAKYIN